MAGADAAQVYVGPPSDQPAGVQFAVRSLAQFDRVELAPGESKKVTLHVNRRALSYWSEAQQKWILDADGRTVSVGDADAVSHLPLQTTLHAPGKGDVTCSNEQINAAVIDGNLNVEKGDWCDLVDVTVNGDLHIDRTSGVQARERRRRRQRGHRPCRRRGRSAQRRHEPHLLEHVRPRPRHPRQRRAALVEHRRVRCRTRSATTSTSTTTEAASDISGNSIGHNLTCDKNFAVDRKRQHRRRQEGEAVRRPLSRR